MRILSFIFMFLLSMLGSPAFADAVHSTDVHIMDWDDTILRMNTKIYLYEKTTGAEISITSAQLAQNDKLIGVSGPYANYEIKDALSFREFHVHSPISFKDQVIETLGKGEAFYGAPGTKEYAHYLSTPPEQKYLFVLTARGHDVDEFMAGQKVLYERGIIPALPLRENIWLADNLLQNPNHIPTAEFKAQKIAGELDKLKPGDSLSFMDDDAENIRKALESIQSDITKSGGTRWKGVKIVMRQGLPDKTVRHVVLADGEVQTEVLLVKKPVMTEMENAAYIKPNRRVCDMTSELRAMFLKP